MRSLYNFNMHASLFLVGATSRLEKGESSLPPSSDRQTEAININALSFCPHLTHSPRGSLIGRSPLPFQALTLCQSVDRRTQTKLIPGAGRESSIPITVSQSAHWNLHIQGEILAN